MAEDHGSVNNPMFIVFTNLLKIIDNDTEFKKALLKMKSKYIDDNTETTNLLTEDDLSEDNLIEIKLYCKAYIYTFLDNENTRDESIDIDRETKKKIVDKNIKLDDTEVQTYLRSYRKKNQQGLNELTPNIPVIELQESSRYSFEESQILSVRNSIFELLKKILDLSLLLLTKLIL